jgi:uncharacterized radical SAM superfamily Fe-S cluster-containing enzyme
MELRDYRLLGTTESLCPECLEKVSAKIIERDGRVYFRKRCSTHGLREDFVCSDVKQYDLMEFSLPAKIPPRFGVEPEKGCPFDCGLCSDHEQHTCIGIVEITSSCNLSCPMCYANSGPGGTHLTFEECRSAIDRLVAVEGRPEILQLSGGEPTIHPEFERIVEYACDQPIDYVMINTNGIRLAHDPRLLRFLEDRRHRLMVYFQFDGFSEKSSRNLRGEHLVDIKLRAIEALGAAGLQTTLVSTLQPGVNDDQIGEIVRFGMKRSWITGISFQPATYSGRHVTPEVLESRITYPDVIAAIEEQTEGVFTASDFMPLPCAHPNCHQIAYAYRAEGKIEPLARFIDGKNNLGLLANGITFTRARARALIEEYLGSQGCCAGGKCDPTPSSPNVVQISPTDSASSTSAQEFFDKAVHEELRSEDVFRITITSFLDAYNFDVRRLMKCCTHFVLPSGHVIPFCAYNVLYRPGYVPLPPLHDIVNKPSLSTLLPVLNGSRG